MLRIKKEVDLKELEKFGFEITKNNYEVMGEDFFEAIKKCGDMFNEYDFIVHGRNLNIYSEINKYEYKYFDLQTLFDLIQAGLVEKVE